VRIRAALSLSAQRSRRGGRAGGRGDRTGKGRDAPRSRSVAEASFSQVPPGAGNSCLLSSIPRRLAQAPRRAAAGSRRAGPDSAEALTAATPSGEAKRIGRLDPGRPDPL